MPMTGFFCQDSYLEKLQRLSDQEVGRLFRALMHYHATGEVVELTGREIIAYDFIRQDIDSDEARHQEKCDQARRNRLSGAGKRDADSGQRALTGVDGRDQNNQIKLNENVKETPLTGSKEKPPRRFSPPTVEEVRAYCQERKNNVDPERFCDYYNSIGWLVGKNRMKDWRATVRTWEKGESRGAARPARTVSAQEYGQRDYNGVAKEIQDEMERDMRAFLEREETG